MPCSPGTPLENKNVAAPVLASIRRKSPAYVAARNCASAEAWKPATRAKAEIRLRIMEWGSGIDGRASRFSWPDDVGSGEAWTAAPAFRRWGEGRRTRHCTPGWICQGRTGMHEHGIGF